MTGDKRPRIQRKKVAAVRPKDKERKVRTSPTRNAAMRQVTIALIAMTWLVLTTWDVAQGQPQPPPTVSVGFRNQTDLNVIVKGYTIVNGMQRSGPIMQLKRNGGRSFEINVPSGIRYYTVYDANQPTKVLLRDHPIPIQRDSLFDIIPAPGNPNRVLIVPASAAGPGMPIQP